MLRKIVKTDEPIIVKVGDVSFTIVKIGERVVDLGISAPRDMPISFDQPGADRKQRPGG